MMRLLLLSNSGHPFLAHCRDAIAAFLGPIRTVGYITAARMGDGDAVHARARDALAPVGVEVQHLRVDAGFAAHLAALPAVFCSGGNTYALLSRLRAAGALPLLRRAIDGGVPYIGTSAGINLAGLNILATNDWNVVGATEFDALGLVPFAINPHYLETDPAMAPHSETRDQRIGEYLSVNANAVVGIEEQTGLLVEDGRVTVVGTGRVKLFERAQAPRWFGPGDALPPQCSPGRERAPAGDDGR